MHTINNRQFEMGDWVKGKTENGEFIHGYIENINLLNAAYRVKVIACDNEKIVGSSIELEGKRLDKLPVSVVDTEGQMHNLIDMALSTKDEQWFNDLSTQLNEMKKQSHQKEKTSYCNAG